MTVFMSSPVCSANYNSCIIRPLGCASYDGMLWKPVHPVLREGGWNLSFDQSSDKPAPHKRLAVLGAAAHHLYSEPAQRRPVQVRFIIMNYKVSELWEGGCIIHQVQLFLLCRHLHKLPRLLESEDVNMRIAAGETIALLFELARDMDSVSSRLRRHRLSLL